MINVTLRVRLFLDFLLICFALMVIASLATGYFNPTDLAIWMSDGDALAGCLVVDNSGHCHGLSKFSAAYLLNSLLHSGDEEQLALLNSAALLLPVACLGMMAGWRLMLRGGSIYMFAIALSPLPAFYVRSGALEVQAGVVSGIFMACLAKMLFASTEAAPSTRLRALLFIFGILLPLYKDTLVVVLGLSVFVIWVARAYRGQGAKFPSPTRLKLLARHTAIPVAVGIAISLSYNMLRYDALIPVSYMQEAAQTTPGLLKSAEFFFGSIMSPNGGVVIFWALPLTVALLGWGIRGLRAEPCAVALVAVAALLSCIGFSRWWAPFGWDAWGNRLMIQPMLAVLVVTLLSLQEVTPQRTLSRSSISGLFALPVLAASAYYMLIPYIDGRDKAINRSLWPGPACVQMLHRLQTDAPALALSFWKTDDYYQCARERMLYVPSPTQ
jgi:hypothetical protein